MRTDTITIGRDPVLTFRILAMIHNRRIRTARRINRWQRVKAWFGNSQADPSGMDRV